MSYKKNLFSKLNERSATIGIVGLGYVGQPLMLRFSEEGYKVIGFDIDKNKVQELNRGVSGIEHINNDEILNACESGFRATDDFSKISKVDAIIICVPTPLNDHREPDMAYINGTMSMIGDYLVKGQVISLESTTYPGCTHELLVPAIEKFNLKVGNDFFLVYSPEREDPGRENFTTKTIPKVCGGETKNCLEIGQALYESVVDTVVKVSSTQAAEMTKLLENIHRAVNIGLVNEMKVVADKMGLDIHEIISAAATKPFGFVAYKPGPGLGGHCIPIDPFYLTWKAREYDVHTRFIELAGEVNNAMPDFVINKTLLALNSRKKTINGSQILVLGISYKKNIDDMRESPAVIIMEKLAALGAEINYSDPHVSHFPKMRKHFFELESVELTKDSLASYDCVILTTEHDKFDFNLINESSSLIIDTRGVFKASDKVVKA